MPNRHLPTAAPDRNPLHQHLVAGRRRWAPKTIFHGMMNCLVAGSVLAAVVPLFSVLYMVVVKGSAHFRFAMLWTLPPGAGMVGGGFGNALVGTVLVVLVAAIISVPAGLATAVYLTEFSRNSRAGRVVRFSAKILSGLPSILAGVFVFATIVTITQKFSLFAGGLSLAVLMLPIITLASEEALLRVPPQLREASLALGANLSQTVFLVIIPAARTSILTGLSLATARAAGESAPLIFTALFSDYWIKNLFEPTASLSVLIYNFSGMPYANQLNIAWAASLVLILSVLITNVTTRILSDRSP
jgi:phosphate transport system permease protein